MIRQILDEYDKKELQDQIDELKTNGGGSSSNETTGTGGSVWFSGTDVRFDGVYQLSAVPGAKSGDYYLNTSSGDVFKAYAGFWGYVCNLNGDPGKSAYEYAVEAGYEGSEEQFASDLADAIKASWMPSADGMSNISSLDNRDAFVVYDIPAGESKKILWESLIPLIKAKMTGAVAANAIVDDAGSGYVATIPELEDDSVIALISDIAKALVDYYTKEQTEEYVEGYAQPVGDYALKSEIPSVPVNSVNGKTGAVQLSASDVGAQPSGSYLVPSDLSGHNTSDASHNDIRLLIEGLTSRLNALANSDDTTLDQMSEIVAYIKNNKSLIDGITASKVNVSDIVNNLATNSTNKPLSAAQGVALKALIDAITVPTKLSDLTEDSSHRVVTDAEKTAWNAKSNFSGKYADLTGQPTIPTKTSQLTNDSNFLTSVPSEYVTETELNAKGYLTSVPSEYVTETELNAKGYLTSVPSEYVTETELNAKGYLTQHQDLSSYAKNSDIPTKVSSLTNDAGYIKQTQLNSAVDDALADAKASGEFDGDPGAPGYTPVKGVDYYTPSDKSEFSEYIASELAKRGQLAPEYAQSEEWLAENGDKSKMYVLPDGMIWAWMLTEKEVETGGSGYDNALDSITKNINKRWSHSSKALSNANGYVALIDIPVKADQTVYVNLPRAAFLGNYPRVHYRDASGNYVNTVDRTTALAQDLTTDANGVTSWKVGYEMTTASDMSTHGKLAKADAITSMILILHIDGVLRGDTSHTTCNAITEADVANIIVSVGNPIEEGGGTTIVTEEAWASTGRAFIPADYEDRIISLEEETAQNTADIETLKKGTIDTGGVDALTWIRNWDSPIYDRVPTFQMATENPAVTSAEKTVASIYAKYDALVTANPNYVTKTDLGVCSDGVTHVYRYDFCEAEPHHQSGMQWSETKPVIICTSGIHWELGGVYSLYYALKEITENPQLDDLRRNVHFVVVPIINPYCFTDIGAYSETQGVLNANGVQIHRNFEVGFIYPGQSGYQPLGNRNHGGTEPLSEIETRNIDNIFKQYPDAALFMTCHSAQRDTRWGTGFIWASTATNYTCNLGYRLVDKMSKAWHKKYGTTWEEGCVRENNFVLADTTTHPNATALAEGDYRAGHAHVSSTDGTETRQATKYGIQGANVEVLDTFWVLSSTGLDGKVTTHGAEVYINYLLMYMGCYDHKDKKEYHFD